jgi:hypothetical protein
MSLFMLGGIVFAGTLPASANAAAGMTGAKIATTQQGEVIKAHWRHHRRGFFFGGYPGYGWGWHRPYYGYGWGWHHRRHYWWRHHHRRHWGYYGWGGYGWRHHHWRHHHRHWRRW